MAEQVAKAAEQTPYALLGGEPTLRRIVEGFYDHMEGDEDVRELRAMHAADLAPMRARLFDYLSDALGGPMLYARRADRKCIVSAHMPFSIDAQARDQWMTCMGRALAEAGLTPELMSQLERSFCRLADALRNR